ncbi:MAG: hypothetical protein EHM85_19920, partial [Desulfobacteraceae bacterium]
MAKKVLFGLLVTVLLLASLLVSCSSTSTTSSQTNTVLQPTTNQSTSTTVPKTTAKGNWWDKLGEPQYGGTLTYRLAGFMATFDPCVAAPGALYIQYEGLFTYDWTVDRNTYPYNTTFVPIKYHMGYLSEKWEQKDPQTLIVYLRHGVHYQNEPPVNGREFTSDDVQQHYDRILGTGSGYTQPNPLLSGWLSLLERVTATDKYTVTVKFKKPSAIAIFQFFDQPNSCLIEPPEV